MNKFEKVSQGQYYDAMMEEKEALKAPYIKYEAIKLPKRGTKGSAGYDFYTPVAISLEPGESVKIPTGIKCQIDLGVMLQLYPRSGLGFKFTMRLNNTVGIVDNDYYDNIDNEGHIFIKITNEGKKHLSVDANKAFAQGIFVPFLLTVDDEVNETRVGGIGSTSK